MLNLILIDLLWLIIYVIYFHIFKKIFYNIEHIFCNIIHCTVYVQCMLLIKKNNYQPIHTVK